MTAQELKNQIKNASFVQFTISTGRYNTESYHEKTYTSVGWLMRALKDRHYPFSEYWDGATWNDYSTTYTLKIWIFQKEEI